MTPVEMIMIRLHSSTRIFLLRFINIPQQQSLDQAWSADTFDSIAAGCELVE